MRIGSLFSGIGGLELGLERSGLGRVVWQCEIDPFCRRVLTPRVVVVENVGAVWREWLPVVRRDLWARGYASMPLRVSPDSLGAPHERDRIFVVAYTDHESEPFRTIDAAVARLSEDARRARSFWGDPFAGPVRLDDGLSRRMGEVRGYGNAVAPPCAEIVGRAIKGALS